MDLIINYESPVPLIEQIHVDKRPSLGCTVGQNLIGGDRDRPYLPLLTGIFPDFIHVQGRPLQQLTPPLLDRGRAGGKNQRFTLQMLQYCNPYYRFARTARQNNNTAAADAPNPLELLYSISLVIPEPESLAANSGPLPRFLRPGKLQLLPVPETGIIEYRITKSC